MFRKMIRISEFWISGFRFGGLIPGAVVQRCSLKKVFLEISQNSHENRPAILLKKRLWNRCFPVNFVKFLGTPFYGTPLVAGLLTLFCLYLQMLNHEMLNSNNVIFSKCKD